MIQWPGGMFEILWVGKWFIELRISTKWPEEGRLLILVTVLGGSGTRCGLRWSLTLLCSCCCVNQTRFLPFPLKLSWSGVLPLGCCTGFQSQGLGPMDTASPYPH